MKVGVYTNPWMQRCGYTRGSAPGGKHWYGQDRYSAFWRNFTQAGLDHQVHLLDAPEATGAELQTFHSPEYLAEVQEKCAAGVGSLDHGPTPAEPHVPQVFAAMVGCVLDGGRKIWAGDLDRAFVPVSGFHHGRPNLARDYCVYNDCALVCLDLMAQGARIAYVDIDVHFGDGLFENLKTQTNLGIVDFHQDPRTFWYSAGTETVPQSQRHFLVTLKPGQDDSYFWARWPQAMSYLRTFAPDMVVLNAGADGLAGDRLGGLRLSPDIHRRVTEDLCTLPSSNGRVLALGGGGYHLDNLAVAWTAVMESLIRSP